jgi:hypothetical protein
MNGHEMKSNFPGSREGDGLDGGQRTFFDLEESLVQRLPSAFR